MRAREASRGLRTELRAFARMRFYRLQRVRQLCIRWNTA